MTAARVDTVADLRRLMEDTGTVPRPWRAVSDLGAWGVDAPRVLLHVASCGATREPDARLIAAAITALPALLDAVEAARRVLAAADAGEVTDHALRLGLLRAALARLGS